MFDDGPYDEVSDDADAEPAPLPATWGRAHAPGTPTFSALHGANHVLAQRLDRDLRDRGVSPSEAVVLAAIRDRPMMPIQVFRLATGLRRSTLTSILDRLEGRRWVKRRPDRRDERFVQLELTAAGEVVAAMAADALRNLDDELAVFVRRDVLFGPAAIFEAARALGVPGTAADLQAGRRC